MEPIDILDPTQWRNPRGMFPGMPDIRRLSDEALLGQFEGMNQTIDRGRRLIVQADDPRIVNDPAVKATAAYAAESIAEAERYLQRLTIEARRRGLTPD